MKKYIVAIGALVALAVPTAAMATVAVDANGNGSIGKGDVQNALGYANDAPFQSDAQAGKIAFSVGSDVTKVYSDVKCSASDNWQPGDPFTEQHNLIATVVQTRKVDVKASTNGAGKVTGYEAKGISFGPGGYTAGTNWDACPAGMHMLGFIDPLAAFHTEEVHGDSNLMVSGNGKTVALPNTPVPAV